jgi:type II secretory pathway pseudopilin PulG
MKMKQIAKIGLVVMAVMALTAAAGATSASATTFEIKGVKQAHGLELNASLQAGSSISITDTLLGGELVSITCSQFKMTSGNFGNPYSGLTLLHLISILEYSSCTQPVIVDRAGKLTFEAISGTTNATVRWTESEVTVPSAVGTLTCKTSNTDIGVLKGVASGKATLVVNAVIPCGNLSTLWTATYVITSPDGLGVTA